MIVRQLSQKGENMEFKIRLKQLREKSKFTQSELADYLQISQSTLSKWESGLLLPKIRYLPPIAKLFNVTVDYLVGLKD